MILNTVVNQVEGNIVSDMDGEKVILCIQNGKYYNLGQVGGDIWSLIQEQPVSIQQIVTPCNLFMMLIQKSVRNRSSFS